MIVHPAGEIDVIGELGGLGVKVCRRCGARLGTGLDSVKSTPTLAPTCTPADPAAVKRERLRDLLDAHAVAKVEFERARLRLDDAWAAVQRSLARVVEP